MRFSGICSLVIDSHWWESETLMKWYNYILLFYLLFYYLLFINNYNANLNHKISIFISKIKMSLLHSAFFPYVFIQFFIEDDRNTQCLVIWLSIITMGRASVLKNPIRYPLSCNHIQRLRVKRINRADNPAMKVPKKFPRFQRVAVESSWMNGRYGEFPLHSKQHIHREPIS